MRPSAEQYQYLEIGVFGQHRTVDHFLGIYAGIEVDVFDNLNKRLPQSVVISNANKCSEGESHPV